MKQLFFAFLLLGALILVAERCDAQTVTLNDAVVVSNNARAGINSDQPSPGFPDHKNYFFGAVGTENPGFEAPLQKQIWGIQISPCQFCANDRFQSSYQNVIFNGYQTNGATAGDQWQNADIVLTQGCYQGVDPACTSGGTSDPALGCTTTVKHSYNQVDATYTGTISGGALASFTASGGSNYPPSSTITLTVTGGGGSGAAAHITTDGSGNVATTVVDTGGSGYTSAPTIKDPTGKPMVVLNASCAGKIGLAGQVFVVSTNHNTPNAFPTSQTWWTANGWSVTNSGTVVSESTDLCATCGAQSMLLTMPTTSATVTAGIGPLLNVPAEKSILLNGTYTISYWAKKVTGSPSIASTLTPRSGSACTDTFAPTTSWAQHTFTCTFAETTSSTTGGFLASFVFSSTSGSSSTDFDNVSMTNNADTNTTDYTDAYVQAHKDWCQSTANTTGPACTIRYGGHPDSETVANWINPAFSHSPTIEAQNGFTTSFFTIRDPLGPWLKFVNVIGGTPVLIFPSTITTTDLNNLLDYLQDPPSGGTTTTTYGGLRQTIDGQTNAWVCASGCPFTQIFLEFGNENWNQGFIGHIWSFNGSAPGLVGFYDYSVRAGTLFTSGRARQTAKSYLQSETQFVLNYQTADKGGNLWFGSGATQGMLQIANPDTVEFNGYTAFNTYDTSATGTTNATNLLYGPVLTEPWSNVNDASSTSGFDQTLTKMNAHPLCGPSHTAYCSALIYEQNTGTFNGSTGYNFGQYLSGGTVTGTSGQTCTLTAFNGAGASGVTATVKLTGTNVIAANTSLTYTATGTPTGASTTATFGNGTASCSGTATIYAPTPFNQAIANSFTAAAVQGIVYAEQIMNEDLSAATFTNVPIISNNAFEINQFYFGEGGVALNMWGTVVGEGDDCASTNSALFGGKYCPRPQFLTAEIYNGCKIGQLVQTTWTSNPTYNLPANNNSVHAINTVPNLQSAEFKSGTKRCIVIINNDIASSHAITFAGTNPPTTNVTVTSFAPSSLSLTNEKGGLSDTRTYVAPLSNTVLTGQNVSSGYTMPANSVVSFAWNSSTVPSLTITGGVKITGQSGTVTVQ